MESLILIILVLSPGVWSADWSVTFENQCALKGTSVVIKCKYDYPIAHFVTSFNWFKALKEFGEWRLFYLSDLPSPPGHFRYVGNHWHDCGLEINDVQHIDEGRYYFNFRTTLGRWTSRTYALLSVSELTAVVQPSTVTEGDDVRLTCVSDCPAVDVVWFRDGQPVPNPAFQARREDTGRYYCAMLGQETVRSASVTLNVQYAPEKVTLSMSPSGDVVKGSSVTFTCSSDANPPVTQSGYSLYKDGHFIGSGLNHTISDIEPSHSGLYHCQAWNNISDSINSPEVHLDVQYGPVNVSISMSLLHAVEGSSVNLTCISDANPAADNYTWYKGIPPPSSMDRVGTGQVLSIPSMEASHNGLYVCQARNQVGESNSAEVLLAMMQEQHGSLSLPVLAGITVSIFVTLVFTLLLFWKHRTHAEKKQSMSGRGSSSSATEDQSDNVYINIHTLPSVPPPLTDITPHSQVPTSYEDEVTYSTVTIKARNPGPLHHLNNSRSLQNPQSKARENDVIYATVVKSS